LKQVWSEDSKIVLASWTRKVVGLEKLIVDQVYWREWNRLTRSRLQPVGALFEATKCAVVPE